MIPLLILMRMLVSWAVSGGETEKFPIVDNRGPEVFHIELYPCIKLQTFQT